MKPLLFIVSFLLLGAAVVVFLGCARQLDDHGAEKLIQDLDSDQFKVRESASAELKKIGLAAEPALRKALANKPALEVEKRIRAVLQEVAPSYGGESNHFVWVYQSLARGQTFRSNGRAIDKLYLRVARWNDVPAADLHVEIRDQWMDGVYARGVIAKADAGKEYEWREVKLSHRARLTPGQEYILLCHSHGTSNESPWFINCNRRDDVYADGELMGDKETDLFFHLRFSERLLHVGPDLKAKGTPVVVGDGKSRLLPLPGVPRLPASDINPGYDVTDEKPKPLAQEPIRCLGHKGIGLHVDLSPNGKVVVSSGQTDKILRFWDATNGKLIRELQVGDPKAWGGIVQVRILPDGKSVVGLDFRENSAGFRYWELESGRETKAVLPSGIGVGYLAFSRDGDRLAIGASQTVQVWDMKKKERVVRYELEEDAGRLGNLAFSGNGKFLAAGLPSGGGRVPRPEPIVRVWEIAKGKTPYLTLERRGVAVVDLSSDGDLLCAGLEEGQIEVWDLPSKKQLWKRPAYDQGLLWLAFNPDGSTVATCGASSAVKLWDARTGKLVRVLEGHKDGVQRLAFSKDGRVLVSAGYDNEILIWR